MDIRKLATEIQDDPENRGYASLQDKQVADDLNEKRYGGPLRLSILDIPGEFGFDISTRLSDSLNTMSSTALYMDLQAVIRTGASIDFNSVSTRTVLSGMAADVNVPLTQADVNAINAKISNRQSRADVLGLGRVKPGHVNQARAVRD